MKRWMCLMLVILLFSCGRAETMWERAQEYRPIYALEQGFDEEDASRPQLIVYKHDYDSWKAGATIEPVPFYINVEAPIRLLGEKSMDLYEASMKYDRTDVGLWLKMDSETYGLVYSRDGVKGVEYSGRLYEAGPDFERMLDIAQEKLGYRPGDMDFLGKKIVQAKFEWQAGDSPREGENYKYGGGHVVITDEKRLARLEEMLAGANYMLGSVNCPSHAFMVLEFEDGSSSAIAVAINSFATFFYRGMCFDFKDGDIIDIFNLDETVFYKAIMGG